MLRRMIIRRPDADHSMELQQTSARVEVGSNLVVESGEALRVQESAGGRSYGPVLYIPRADIPQGVLQPAEGTTWCPLKGTASYFDVTVDGTTYPRGAWSYESVLDFDPNLEAIRGLVAFDGKTFSANVVD